MDFYDQVLASLPKATFKLNGAGTAYTDLTNRGATYSGYGRVNMATNPSMRSITGTNEVRRNWAYDPNCAGSTSNFGTVGASPAAATVSIATDRFHNGTTSFKKVYTGSGQGGAVALIPGTVFRLNVGEKVNVSLWVYSTVAATGSLYVEGVKVSDGTYQGMGIPGGTTSIPANTWTFVSGSNSPSTDMYVQRAGIYNMTVNAGDTQWFDEFLVEKAEVALPYFDGGTTAANGLTYTWAGSANASSSIATGNKPTTYTNGTLYVNGNKMVIPAFKTTSTDTYVTLTADVGAIRYPFEAGKTYTISATGMASAADAGESANRGRRIVVFHKTPSTGYIETNSSPVPVGSEARVSVTVTIPSDASEAFVRFYNGSLGMKREVYYKDILIETGPVLSQFFDGSTPLKTRRNIITNPNAAVDIVGWNGNAAGGTMNSSRITGAGGPVATTAHRWTWTVDATTDTGGVYFGSASNTLIPITQGTTYTASGYVRSSKSQRMVARIYYYDSTGAFISAWNGTEQVVSANTWTRLSTTNSVAPANAVRGLFALYSWPGTGLDQWNAGDTLDAQGLLLEESSTLGTFFDGSTADNTVSSYTWEGTANASASFEEPTGYTYSWTGTADSSTSKAVKAIELSNSIVAGSTKSLLIGPNNTQETTVNIFSQGTRGAFSLESVFLPYTFVGNLSILSRDGDYDGLYFDGDKMHFKLLFQGQGSVDAAWPVPDFPDAMHLVGVWTGRSALLYINGQLMASAEASDAQLSAGFTSRASNSLISGQSTNASSSGVIDGTTLYNRSLSDSEIYRHSVAARRVIASQDISGAYGGFGWNDMRRDVFSYTEWSGKDWYNGVYTDVEFEGGGLRPAENPATQLSIAGVWTGVYSIGAYGSTVYGVKVDWDGDGSYVVQASLDGGSTWTSSLVNGRTVAGTWSWNSTDKTLLVRVTFTGGVADDIAEIRRLRVTGYTTSKVYANDNSRYIDIEGVSASVANEGNEPIENNSGAGIEIYGSTVSIKPDATADIRPVAALEVWVKFNESVLSKYVFDARPGGDDSYLWINGSGVMGWAGATVVYANGQAITNNTYKPVAGVWYHFIFVYDTPINTDIKFTSTGNKNLSVVNVYPVAPTAAQAAAMYNAYNGYPSSLLATEDINVQELATPFKTYGYDWSMTGVG